METEWDREGAARAGKAADVSRFHADIGADHGLAGHRDDAAQAVSFGPSEDALADSKRDESGAEHELQLLGLAVREPVLEVIESEERPRCGDHFALQKLEALGGVQLAKALGVELEERCARLIDRLEAVLDAARRGGVDKQRHNAFVPPRRGRAVDWGHHDLEPLAA